MYELAPSAAGTVWTHTVLYSFCAHGGPDCTDGYLPSGVLTMDPSGNLYGTTSGGGTGLAGTVFELLPNKTGTAWTQKVLHNFCTDCGDGSSPSGGLTRDASGNLFGTTPTGGFGLGGIVFELMPNAAKTLWIETVLCSFSCSFGGCPKGRIPGGLIEVGNGTVYGETLEGGGTSGQGQGTVFTLAP